MVSAASRSSAATSSRSAWRPTSRPARSRNGARSATAAPAAAIRSRAASSPSSRSAARLGRLPVGHGVTEAVPLRLQLLVLVGAGDGDGVDLGHLEAQEIQLPRPGPVVAAEVGQRRFDRPQLRSRRLQGGQVDGPEAVEGGPLGRALQQGLVGVLAVEVDQLLPRLAQGRGGGQPAVDVGPAPPVGGDDPAEDDLLVVPGEATLDDGLVAGGADQDGIGPAADQQLHGLDQQGLARAGLPRQGGHARAQHELEAVDDAEVLDGQLDQHQRLTDRPGRTWPSGSGGSPGSRT